jgi:putative transposase
MGNVIRYIQKREEHHGKNSFKSEYLGLLRKFDVAFEDKYIFNFIED